MNHEKKILNAILSRELQGIRTMLEAVLSRGNVNMEEVERELDRIENAFKDFKGEKGDPLTYEQLTNTQKVELKGKDGLTPQIGKHYFTKEHKLQFIRAIQRMIKVPVSGKDYFTSSEKSEFIKELTKHYPKKGRDYFTDVEMKKFFSEMEKIALTKSITIKTTTIKETAQTILDEPAKIARALEKLKGKERLDAKAIKNLPIPVTNVYSPTFSSGGGSGTVSVANLSSQCDGVTTQFVMPSFSAILMVIITGWAPNGILNPSADYTTPDAVSMDLVASQVSAPASGTTLIALYIPT